MAQADFSRSRICLEGRGTWEDHPLSPACRNGTGHRCLNGCPRILDVVRSPRAAPPGLGDSVAPFCAREGHRSWCLKRPSLEGLLRSSCAARHRSLCPYARPAAGPCHGGPRWLAALPWKKTPWRRCPPWGLVSTASAMPVGSSLRDRTLRQCPCGRQGRG